MSVSDEVNNHVARVEELLHDLQVELEKTNQLVPLVAEDWEDLRLLAEVLYTMDAIKNQLKVLYENYEQAVWPSFEGKQITLANGATLEGKESIPRAGWNHKGLANLVAQRIVDQAFDFDTGEMLKSHEEMVKDLMRYAGVGYWKVKELRRIGIDPDNYSVPKDAKRGIVIKKPREQ